MFKGSWAHDGVIGSWPRAAALLISFSWNFPRRTIPCFLTLQEYQCPCEQQKYWPATWEPKRLRSNGRQRAAKFASRAGRRCSGCSCWHGIVRRILILCVLTTYSFPRVEEHICVYFLIVTIFQRGVTVCRLCVISTESQSLGLGLSCCAQTVSAHERLSANVRRDLLL